jgi:hypothetical protein
MIIAIGGEPATGKSTLMKQWMKDYTWDDVKCTDLLYGMHCQELNTIVLGKDYFNEEQMFCGTDRLSMAVQPKAIEWFKTSYKPSGVNIVFEGDRLFSASFLGEMASQGHDIRIIYIKADQSTLDERHVSRNDNQDDKFLKSRKTKLSNILSNFELMPYIEEFTNNTIEDQSVLVELILKELNSSDGKMVQG